MHANVRVNDSTLIFDQRAKKKFVRFFPNVLARPTLAAKTERIGNSASWAPRRQLLARFTPKATANVFLFLLREGDKRTLSGRSYTDSDKKDRPVFSSAAAPCEFHHDRRY